MRTAPQSMAFNLGKFLPVCFAGLLTSAEFAPASGGFPETDRFTAQGRLVTYQSDGRIAGETLVGVSASFEGRRYHITTTYPHVKLETSFDGENACVITSFPDDPASGKGMSHALPADISRERYPLDAHITEQAAVLAMDVLQSGGHPAIRFDPFLNPRLHVAFEAVTQVVSRGEDGATTIRFEVDPKVVKRLLENREETHYVDLWRDNASLQSWNMGFVEGNTSFTNSEWTVSKVSQSEYRIEGTRFRSPFHYKQGTLFETFEMTLDFSLDRVEGVSVPDVSDLALSVFDRRLADRSAGVSGVHYSLNGTEWPSPDSESLKQLFLFEAERAFSKRMSRLVRRFAVAALVTFVLGGCAMLLFLRSRGGEFMGCTDKAALSR